MTATKTGKLQILSWALGEQNFGLALARCREVEQDPRITRVPHAREYIAGIANLRGDVVTVIDLRVILDYKTESSSSAGADNGAGVIIRLKSSTQELALLADRINDILVVGGDSLEPVGAHLSEAEARFVEAVVMTRLGPMLLLNANEILEYKP